MGLADEFLAIHFQNLQVAISSRFPVPAAFVGYPLQLFDALNLLTDDLLQMLAPVGLEKRVHHQVRHVGPSFECRVGEPLPDEHVETFGRVRFPNLLIGQHG